jgi:hypothetical protein
MKIRIFNQQSFRDGRRIKVRVGGNQREGLAQSETAPVDLECRRQLHGIVSPKKMAFRQPHGLFHEGRPDRNDVKTRSEVGTEKSERRGCMDCG